MLRLVEGHAAEGRTPLTMALARALARPHDSTLTHVACAWIAAKFEEVYPSEPWELLHMANHRHVSTRRLAGVEAAVLERCDWVIPYRTPVRRILHLLNDAAYCDALHALLWADMDALYPPDVWAYLMRDHPRHPAVQLVAARLRGRIACILHGFRARTLPPRIRATT
tara:strand:+ start:571 stop:1074 length:504 start_codon:yes stop_codon:yes gene_type:complete